MALKRPVFILLCACIIAAWVVAARLALGIGEHSGTRHASPDLENEAAFSASFALVEKALGLPPAPPVVRYGGGFESPFKTVWQERQGDETVHHAAAAASARPRLSLKGILYKSNPLAILEDANGKTSILGVGDTLSGQKVTAIQKTAVTLRDRHGAYVLTVKE
ncbi:MAG TPA: hypothetical protein VLX68_05515 [Chitinivibrionales bacterium]|nr:hypothetical protein [Chitinivibrionales bacterium]